MQNFYLYGLDDNYDGYDDALVTQKASTAFPAIAAKYVNDEGCIQKY